MYLYIHDASTVQRLPDIDFQKGKTYTRENRESPEPQEPKKKKINNQRKPYYVYTPHVLCVLATL